MTTPVEIKAAGRNRLIPLFEDCKYDRVILDSVLEGNFGSAFTDSVDLPIVVRLDSGKFTILGGNPKAKSAKSLLHLAPINYVTPQDDEWRRLLQNEFSGHIYEISFTAFSPKNLDMSHLEDLISAKPNAFELKRIEKPLAEQMPSDVGNEHFYETFETVDDFLHRGIGFCILYQDKIVSAATSMARSSKAIDIEIATVPNFREQGLGTVVGAKLVSHCLERGIEPCWIADSTVSEKLAIKLGYTKGETYTTYEIQRN